MKEKKLHLRVDLTADVRDVKNDAGGLKSDVVGLTTGVNELRTDMNERFHEVDQQYKAVDRRFKEAEQRFDKVDRSLTGSGGQFEVQTEQRLNDKNEMELKFSAIKVRLFDLETKVNRTY